jgi:hypothetical protein
VSQASCAADALGKRERRLLAKVPSHPFYGRLGEILSKHGFDDFVEAACKPLYAERTGRLSLPPGCTFGCCAGIATPTRVDLARLDRRPPKGLEAPARPGRANHQMKDGRTDLAHKAEHAVDMETGAISPSQARPAPVVRQARGAARHLR